MLLRVEKTLTITSTGVLTVKLTILPGSRSYLVRGITAYIEAAIDTATPYGPFPIIIDWGDGKKETYLEGIVPPWVYSHMYASVGTYTVTVNVTDLYTGATGSDSKSVEIREELTIDFKVDKATGPVPLTVTFTCTASKGYLPYSWTLDPGDGSTPYSGTRTAEGSWTQSHTYNKIGTFTAKLTVTDALGVTIVGLARITAFSETVKEFWSRLTPLQKGLLVVGVIGGVAGGAYALTRKRK
ncbi:MAG: PKD domain-containing protein [Thermoproteota archaeon]